MNQCWNIVNWIPRNNSYIFIQENPFENVVWKMSAILSRPQCVKSSLCLRVAYCSAEDKLKTYFPPNSLFFVISNGQVTSFKMSNEIWRHFAELRVLTHWSRDKMAAISQTTLSNAFSWMKMLEFRLKFHWSLFIRVQFTIVQHWFRWWLGADQATSHYLNQWFLDNRRIYASLGLNELTLMILMPEYSEITRPIPLLMMPRRLASPGHQWP